MKKLWQYLGGAALLIAGVMPGTGRGEEMKTYRLGVVSLDQKANAHSFWFPHFLNRTNLEAMAKYREKIKQRLEKHPSDSVAGFDVVRIWAEKEELKNALAETFSVPEKAADWKQAGEGMDGVLVIDTMSNGDRHRETAEYFLGKGVPVFVDKPFAPDPAAAGEIVATAKKTGTPLFSASVFRYLDETIALRKKLPEIGPVRFVEAIGNGDTLQYGIHPLEFVYGIVGPGVVSVRNAGDGDADVIHLKYADGKEATVLIYRSQRPDFAITIYGAKGILSSGPIKVEQFDPGARRMMETFAEMVKTKTPPVPYDELVEEIKVLSAAIESRQNQGKEIAIK